MRILSPKNHVFLQVSYLTNEEHKGIAVIEFNRPDAKNALNKSIVERLHGAVDKISHDKNVRVVVM